MTHVLRWIDDTFITGAVPVEVVEQTSDFVAVFQPGGSFWKRASGVRTGPRGRNMVPSDRDGGHEDREWTGDGVVRVHRFGDEWSVWRWIDDAGEWSEYFYINLEDPWRVTPIGFDTGDWELDIVGTPTSWSYKDADELEWTQEIGRVSPEWLARTRAAGLRASRELEANGWPFSADWTRWQPQTSGVRSVLPQNWADGVTRGTGL